MKMEALVWNTRLKIDRGMGVADNCVVLLNGQTTKQDSIALVERVGGCGCLQTRGLGYGTMSPMYLSHVPKVVMEPIRGFYDVLRQKPVK
jgi:hypothetical protein